MSEGRVRVATVNLFARHGDWPRRRHALQHALRALDADVLALQEAVVDSEGDTAEQLLGDGYDIVHQRQGLVGDGAHRGASVASRWPVRAVHEVDLHLTDRTHDYSCGTVLVEVDSPVGPLLVGSHGSSWAWWAERERELQAVAVVRAVEDRVGDGRVRHVSLTDRGRAAIGAGREHRAALEAELGERLGPRRVEAARRLLAEAGAELGAGAAVRGRRVRPPR